MKGRATLATWQVDGLRRVCGALRRQLNSKHKVDNVNANLQVGWAALGYLAGAGDCLLGPSRRHVWVTDETTSGCIFESLPQGTASQRRAAREEVILAEENSASGVYDL